MRRTVIAFIVICVWAAGAAAEPADRLRGVAPYVELQRELFLAGLYVPPDVQSASEALAARGGRAMELRFAVDELMSAKLARLFIQSVAINTSPEAQRRSGDSLASFFNALKGRLHRDDVLRIVERADASGVRVVLNDVELVAIDDPGFFNLLLATWVGAVPPSRDFKAALLGESDPSRLARYRRIQPSEQRRQAVALWVTPFEPTPAGEPALAVANAAEPAKPEAEVADAAEPAPEPPGDGPVAQEAASVSSVPASAKPAAPAPGEPAPAEAAGPVVADAGDAAQQSAPATQAPPRPVSQGETRPAFSGETLQAIQRYTAELVNLTHEHVRYPRRAMKLRQTGSVRMAVVINASGEVIKVQPLLESGYSQLDDAVERAIRNTEPYPAIPGKIAAQQFEFVFPITFMLES